MVVCPINYIIFAKWFYDVADFSNKSSIRISAVELAQMFHRSTSVAMSQTGC
jgi:hypothetical protein